MRPRQIRAALALAALLAAPAAAQERPSTPALICAQATALVRACGAIVLGTGGQTYDRFVSGDGGCAIGQTTKPAFAPTRDDPRCLVGYTCIDPSGRGGG